MPSILIADTLAQRGIDMLSERHQVEVRTGLSEDELLAAVAEVNGLVVRSQTQVTARVIDAARKLEVIGRAGVGVDNIDVDAATQRGLWARSAGESRGLREQFEASMVVPRSRWDHHAGLEMRNAATQLIFR